MGKDKSEILQKSNSKQELLENTIKHFNSSNRSISLSGACMFKNKDGNRCAIGREIDETLIDELDSKDFSSVSNDEVFEKLPKRLKDMGQGFLHKIQMLHDDKSYWDETGLSKEGKFKVHGICQEYDLDIPSEALMSF